MIGNLLTANDIYTPGKDRLHPLGALGMDEYGDLYRFTKLAADVSAGYLLVGLGREAYHQDVALSVANAVGDRNIYPTVGATAVDANEYDEGWAVFNDNSPEGEAYRIVSHDASAGSEAVLFTLDRGLKAVTTTATQIALVRNPWNCPAVSQLIAEPACGVTMTDVDVSEAPYVWLKTRGVASVLADGTITVGYKVAISDATNGAVGLYSDVDAEVPVGQMMQAGVSGEFNPVNLFID
jgi:hypothetical protein